ncbi:MAG: LysR family transcriptional regulator [Candidatus Leucobacter sulfamidivorax]|nr:LysR family transcriptional regulator [Candidatus Leucobacter sulfamidivorax]
MSSPTFVELQHFEAAVRNGSLSRAAKELGVSQQAVSYRVRSLERMLGLELIQRSPFGVAPTEVGATVLGETQEVLAAVLRLDTTASRLRGDSAAPSLSVGASQTIAAHLLPGWIVGLRRRQERAGLVATAVGLRTANSEEIIAMVRAGSIDVGFIEQPEPPRDLGSAVVQRDRMIVAVATDHPWSVRTEIPLVELADLPLVSREPGSGTRAAYEDAVRTALGRAAAQPVVSLATEAAVRSAVALNVAPAVLSELTVRDDVHLDRLRALAITPQEITRPFTAIWRGSKRNLTGVAQALISVASAAHREPAPILAESAAATRAP